MVKSVTVPNISATEPDWSREQLRRWWNPSRQLLKSIRKYQKWQEKGGFVSRFLDRVNVLQHRFSSVVSGAEIPLNCNIGGGLLLTHPNGVVIHPDASIGPNCLIFQSWGNEYDYTSSWHPNAILNDCGDGDFNTFVRKVIRKRPGYVTEFYGWYTQPGVRFIGKQETLVDDLIYVLRQINIKFDEERLKSFQPKHVSKSPNKPIVWDEELKIEVERLEYASLIRYGYPTPYSNK